ncbi:hypothetical protein [Hymenobacter chitinivorans]|uniref:Helix-turn-helix protein n=1 Tax=Hymenobacter chitinivorans DSM 11115 TaxID=1121954 RepID=A0A2M9BS32_9BACT|nr:hypothetical protein [Hymenobacter chitinivorans]PJJ60753.1 hypothetical protein CLV45_2184 [Hymenobacter chitinivorans DSM 11115]
MRLPRPGPLPALRRYLALTQASAAALLGTTRSRLAQAEAGTRPLPAAAEAALTALLAALPAPTRRALTIDPGHAAPPPAPAGAPLPAPHLPALAARRHEATQALRRAEAALAAIEARVAAGQARLALLASPEAPATLAADPRFALEADHWTGPLTQADRRLLQASCAGLRAELAVLGG